VYKQILINAKLQIGKRSQKQIWKREVHYGDEEPHWTGMPFNNNNNNNNNNNSNNS
jgi:hypothetical protein